jgi:hypothetical protein
MTDTVPGRRYDAALHLLDRQLIDPAGRLVAKVDDLELTERDGGRLVITAILTGPGVLGPRLGGRLGHWVAAIWSRLRTDAVPSPGRIPFSAVSRIDSAIHLTRHRSSLDVDGFEQWLRTYVIARIPGSAHEPE